MSSRSQSRLQSRATGRSVRSTQSRATNRPKTESASNRPGLDPAPAKANAKAPPAEDARLARPKGVSALDVIEQYEQPDGEAVPYIGRAVVVCELTDEASQKREEVAQAFRDFVTEGFFQTQHYLPTDGESALSRELLSVTGLLIVLQKSLIHVLEGAPELISASMRALSPSWQAPTVLLPTPGPLSHYVAGTTVVLTTENVERCFPEWSSLILDVGQTEKAMTLDGDDFEAQNLAMLASDVYQNILSMGSDLLAEPEQLMAPTNTLLVAFKDKLPANDRLLRIAEPSDSLLSLEDWLTVYDRVEGIGDVQATWPIT